jgi:hypothetical protein
MNMLDDIFRGLSSVGYQFTRLCDTISNGLRVVCGRVAAWIEDFVVDKPVLRRGYDNVLRFSNEPGGITIIGGAMCATGTLLFSIPLGGATLAGLLRNFFLGTAYGAVLEYEERRDQNTLRATIMTFAVFIGTTLTYYTGGGVIAMLISAYIWRAVSRKAIKAVEYHAHLNVINAGGRQLHN